MSVRLTPTSIAERELGRWAEREQKLLAQLDVARDNVARWEVVRNGLVEAEQQPELEHGEEEEA